MSLEEYIDRMRHLEGIKLDANKIIDENKVKHFNKTNKMKFTTAADKSSNEYKIIQEQKKRIDASKRELDKFEQDFFRFFPTITKTDLEEMKQGVIPIKRPEELVVSKSIPTPLSAEEMEHIRKIEQATPSELKTSTAIDPDLLEAAFKLAETPEEIKNLIPKLTKLRDEMMKTRIHTVGALAEVRRELEEANKPKPAFQLKEIKEVLDENPDLAEDIYEEVQKAYAKGELTKDEYTTIKKVIPEDLKDVTAFKVKRKAPKYKSVSKKEIREIRSKKSKSPQRRRRNF